MKGLPQHILFLITITLATYLATSQTPQTTPIPINPVTKCQKTQYTSLFTRCDITFDFCNATTFSFLKCYKRECDRYIRAAECRLWTKIQLNETQCYKQCCGTTNFDQTTCNFFNSQKEDSQTKINGVIIAVIVLSALILVAVTAYLLIKVQKCCKKGDVQKISKYKVFWRDQKVMDSTCQLCKNYNAAILTPCNHYFHASCFEQKAAEKDVPLCPTCHQPIKERLKIACTGCKEKVFKIKLWRISHLQQILKEARALHDQICSESAKSDQQILMSPNILQP